MGGGSVGGEGVCVWEVRVWECGCVRRRVKL